MEHYTTRESFFWVPYFTRPPIGVEYFSTNSICQQVEEIGSPERTEVWVKEG